MVTPARPLFTSSQWVAIIGGLVVAGVSVTAFAFGTFVQKIDFESRLTQFEKAQERIENKLDADLAQHRR